MVFKDCHLLQIQIITNAELAPTICMFAIFYKIWCYQTDKSGFYTLVEDNDNDEVGNIIPIEGFFKLKSLNRKNKLFKTRQYPDFSLVMLLMCYRGLAFSCAWSSGAGGHWAPHSNILSPLTRRNH